MSDRFKNSLLFNSTYDVAEICKDFFSKSRIDFFSCERIDLCKGTASILTTKPESTAYVVNNSQGPTSEELKNNTSKMVILSDQCGPPKLARDNSKWNRRIADSKLFNINHPLSIIDTHGDFSYIYQFGLKNYNDSIEYYLNNIDYINNFIFYFKEQSHKLIENSHKNPFNLPCQFLEKSLSHKKYHQLPEQDKILSLQNSMKLNSIVLEGYNRISTLNRREFEVLCLFLKGHNNKTSAAFLKISIRTVETCIRNLKLKLGHQNKSQLLELIKTNGLHDFCITYF